MNDGSDQLRVLMCGSRRWDDPVPVGAVLDRLLTSRSRHQLLVIEGGNRGVREGGRLLLGADQHANLQARGRGVAVTTVDAEWARLGRRAGPVRNRRMLAEHRPQLVVAFSDTISTSAGTTDMVRIARDSAVPVLLVCHRDPVYHPAGAEMGWIPGCVGMPIGCSAAAIEVLVDGGCEVLGGSR